VSGETPVGWGYMLTKTDADYYLIEFGNEALKLQKAAQGAKA
jgi:hypothetical protein